MSELIHLEQIISNELEEAIENKRIKVYLQGIYNRKGNIIGAEALMRWISKDGNMLQPAKLIPILEESGLIIYTDCYIWEECCKIISSWEKSGKDVGFVSVNISRVSFMQIDIVKELMRLVEKYNIPTSKLKLEITESIVMTDIKKSIDIIDQLHKEGFLVSLDDFGNGYSSLNVLKDLIVDIVKLDMKFLQKTENEERKKIIIESLIKLIGKLNAEVIAEGVETEEDFRELKNMGCSMFQGYYLGKPIEQNFFKEVLA